MLFKYDMKQITPDGYNIGIYIFYNMIGDSDCDLFYHTANCDLVYIDCFFIPLAIFNRFIL